MMPFSGFMQAVNSFAPMFGGATPGQGNGLQGLHHSGDAVAPLDDAAGSFLQRIQQLMDDDAPVGTDVESILDFPDSDRAANVHTGDQLKLSIDDAVDQTPAVQTISQSMPAVIPDNGRVRSPLGTVEAMPAQNDGHLADNPAPKGLPIAQEAVGEPLEIGMVVEKENPSTGAPHQPSADGPLHQTTVSGMATHTKPDAKPVAPPSDEGKDNPTRFIEEHGPSGLKIAEKAITPASSPKQIFAHGTKDPDPMRTASTGDEGKDNPARFIQERVPAESNIAEKAIEPASFPIKPLASSTKNPDSMRTALTDEHVASSEDDRANIKGKDKPGPTPRFSLADVKENEWAKDQTTDSVKGSISEQTKAHPSSQDGAKVMSADPSPTGADKPTVGQATAMNNRTDPSPARTFQTTVMDQIVDKAALRSIHGRSEIQIRLKPEFLGNVQMNIATDKEQLLVRIVTDQPLVKEIIETHLHHLKTELQNQGLTIDKFDVMVNPDADQQHNREPFAQLFKHQSFQNGRRQPQEKNPDAWNGGDDHDADDDQTNREGVNYFA